MWSPNKKQIKNKKIGSRERDYIFSKTGNVYKGQKNHECKEKSCPWCIENKTRSKKYNLIKKELK